MTLDHHRQHSSCSGDVNVTLIPPCDLQELFEHLEHKSSDKENLQNLNDFI